jgi:phosphatidylserine/phosphatidylglycerophosphate/cardiolipin synthase-like enzyme
MKYTRTQLIQIALFAAISTVTQSTQAVEIPGSGTLEVAFSPDEGAEELLVKLINTADSDVKVLAYSFTSVPITSALIRAKKRGASCAVVADEKHNTQEDKSGKARAALSALRNAGCDVRLIGAYAIHHKQIIVNRLHVSTGSFNFSASAAHRNSEQVLVNWNNPKLAAVYLPHFERNYRLSTPFTPGY